MKRKLWVLFLGFVLFLVPLERIAGQTTNDQSKLAAQIEKIKTAISKRATSSDTRVKLKLRSGEEVEGKIDRATDDNFTLNRAKTGQMTVSYADVARIKGHGLSTGAKIGIIAGGAVAAFVIIGLLSFRHFDPFKGGGPIIH
jgi:hypothetical protein